MSKLNDNITNYRSKPNPILKIFIVAILLRLAMLVVFYLFENQLGSYLYLDDWKYEFYANIYMNISNGIFDLQAMQSTDKIIGGVNVAHFFFRYNGILLSITKSTLYFRLSNILFSSLTVLPLYHLSKEVLNERAASISAWIFAVLPYHIMMSVFTFKDILMVFLFTSSLYFLFRYYNIGKLNFIGLILVLIPLPWLRDGLSLFILLLLTLIVFIRIYKNNPKIKKYLIITIPIFTLLALFIFRDTIILLLERVDYYMINGRVDGGGINFIRIDNLRQLYKLPLTWGFSTIFPLSTSINLSTWSGYLMLFNYSLFLIAPAYVIYMLFTKKSLREYVFFIPMLGLHLAVIILVINIPRHYYFLHFYMIMGGAAYIDRIESKTGIKRCLFLSVISLFVFLLAVQIVLK